MLSNLIHTLKKVVFNSKISANVQQAEDALLASVLAYMAKPPFLGRQPIPSSPFIADLGNDRLLAWLETELSELGKVRKDSSNFIFNFLSELADVIPLALEARARRLTLSKPATEALLGLVELGMSPGLGRLFFRIHDLKSEARSLVNPERS